PGVLLNDEMEVLQFRGHTSDYLEPAPGAASFNVMNMAREGLLPDLRGAIHEARKGRAPVRREGIRVKAGDRFKTVHLNVYAIRSPRRAGQFFLVLFEEPVASPAEARDMRRPVPRAAGKAGTVRERRESEGLRRELAATKDYLQSSVEAQQATNEELKAANEEILSSNEELQSTNEELTTLNEELQNRNLELSQVNNDILNLLNSINIPVVMLGPDLRIRRFTPQAEKVLNLIPGDMGRPITDIRLNINLPDLDELLLQTIDTVSDRHLEVQDKQGRWYSLWIRPYKTSDNKIDGAILALVDIHPFKVQTVELASAKTKLEAEIADHERAEEALRKAHEGLELRVQERTAQLREVSARVTRLQDDERRRLAQELHDTTGQNLVALKMNLGAVQESPIRLDPKTRKTLAESQELAEQCIREVRTLSYLLHPPLLDERGLASALRVYAEGFSERSGVSLDMENLEEFGRLPQELEIAVFRLAQECLTNIHRHSGSATARVRLEKTDSEVRLEVSDAGHGFSAGPPRDMEERGIGIRAMRERARQLGGRLEIDSGPSGTRVLAVLPLPRTPS
ncbi:MAG TPA: PAS domain-containing protein, partial [Candidatus Polarisedimenticolia bacterium]|nr:PAS domain-containing protein [Candidatus Polarisedimenticolia bacterium]